MKKNLFFALVFLSVNSMFAQDLTITTEVCADASSVRLTGPWWGWSTVGGPEATSNGNGTWTFTLPGVSESMEYLLVVDGFLENLIPGNTNTGDWSCTPITDSVNYANRQWVLGSGDVSNVYGTCGSCTDLVVYGCTDSSANNYNANATEDDGTCLFGINLPIDFEGSSYVFTDFDGAGSAVVSNPFNTADNSSENVVEHVRNGGEFWAGTYLSVNPINFTSSSIIKMKVYSPGVDIPVLLKLEDPIGGAAFEITMNTTEANQWEELSFDFTGQPSDLYTRLVIIFNMQTVGDGSANSTYYFDDIAFATGPISGCTDVEANNYNPSATIDDGSCTYGAVSFDITVNPCAEATSVRLTGPFWAWSDLEGPEAVKNSNGTWTFNLSFEDSQPEDMQYLFVVDSVREDLVAAGVASDNWSCTPVTDYFSYANRLWTVGSGDVTDVIFNTCGSCDNDFNIEDLEFSNLVYPNPSSDFITLPNNTVSLEIYSITGQRVANVLNTNNTISIAYLPMGIYTIKLIDGNGNTSFNKFVKENK